jgi:hypothetical protein
MTKTLEILARFRIGTYRRQVGKSTEVGEVEHVPRMGREGTNG